MDLKRTLSANKKWHVFSAAANDFAHKSDDWSYICDTFPTEMATRWRYDLNKKEFFSDKVSVKIDNKPFANGAMRECFRAKKLSNFCGSHTEEDWHLPFANVVAKRYMKETDRQTYFDDVKLQMDAKYWAEEFNKAGPPKKIDIMQMMIIELSERPDKPLYHVETIIEGKYVKYNSNSGYVESHDHVCRNTPQAFSHFTFEASGHKCMVVDIQGVGDIYTDPQIHTYNAQGYGSGNLATQGMSLFFNTHRCNIVCEALNLSSFDLTKKEKKRTATIGDGVTQLRSDSLSSDGDYGSYKDDHVFHDSGIEDSVGHAREVRAPKIRLRSSTLEIDEHNGENPWDTSELNRSLMYDVNNRRPSCVDMATRSKERKLGEGGVPEESLMPVSPTPAQERATILGQIHFDLSVYHYMGRFEEDRAQDGASSVFHLEKAAQCGLSLAEFTLGCLHLNIYHDELRELQLNEHEISESKGMLYMEKAAKHGNITALLTVAQAYQEGLYSVEKRWMKAQKYYQGYLDMTEDLSTTDDMSTFEPRYQIQAKLAAMLCTGGHGLDKDANRSGELYSEAADSAMAAMNGRLANKFYMLAEEAWASEE